MSRIRQTTVRALRKMMARHEHAGPAQLRILSLMMRYAPLQMTCIEFERFVYEYYVGTLKPREKRRFELHMDICPMCRVYLASYQRTVELGKRICTDDECAVPSDVPEELVLAILDARSAR